MSTYASTSTAPALPTIEMLDYDETWDVPLEEAPRPANKFMLFLKWMSRSIEGSNAQTAAPIWHSSPSVKKHFDNLQKQVKEKHRERFSNYVYAPQKKEKGKTKKERKENARPYPSSNERRRCTLGGEEMREEVVGEGSSLGVQESDETTQLQRNILQFSSAANYTAYDPSRIIARNHPPFVAQQHNFNLKIHHSNPHRDESILPPFVAQPHILSIQEEEDDTTNARVTFETHDDNPRLKKSSVPDVVQELDISYVEEEEETAMTTSPVEIESVDYDDSDVVFSGEDLNHLSSVLFGFDINDWVVFDDLQLTD